MPQGSGSGSGSNRQGGNRGRGGSGRGSGGGRPRSGSQGRGPRGPGGQSRSGGGRPAGRGEPRRRVDARVDTTPAATAPPAAVQAPPLLEDPTAAVAGNRRRALVIAAAPGAVVLVVLVVVLTAAGALVAGLAAGVVLGVLVSGGLWRGATPLLLRALGARPVDEEDVPGPATLVEGLCASMGLAPPELFVVDDALPNALAVGRAPSGAVLVLTSGLLQALDPVSLEGVLAHELAHVKRNDVAPATMAAALLFVVAVVPGAPGLVHRLAGRGREFATDRQAVRVTRYPPGLRHALTTMSAPVPGGGAVAARRVGQVTRWLWTAVLPDPEGRRPDGDDTVGELDAPSVRAAALDEW